MTILAFGYTHQSATEDKEEYSGAQKRVSDSLSVLILSLMLADNSLEGILNLFRNMKVFSEDIFILDNT